MRNILILYYRLSLADTDKEELDLSNSIKNQKALLNEYVKNHEELLEYEIMEVCDDGYSGTNFQRPGIQKVLELVKKGNVKCILVKDFSRFGRNYIEVGVYLEQIFPFLKVRFISVNDNFDSKKDSAAGAIDVGFKNLMHDYYSKSMGKKISQAKRFRARQGTIIMPAFYGYKKSEDGSGSLVIDDEVADVVRLMFQKKAEGWMLRDIAKHLNELKIPTPSMRKNQLEGSKIKETEFWKADIISPILKDIRYTGVFIFGKKRNYNFREKKMPESDWIISKSKFEPIISKDLFDEVNTILYKRNTQENRKPKQTTVFGDKLQCGCCGRRLYKRDSGYRCRTWESKNDSKCPHTTYQEAKIEAVVLEALNNLLKLTDIAITQSTNVCENEIAPAKLKLLLDQCKKDILSVYESYTWGNLSLDEYADKRNKLQQKIVNIESMLDDIAKQHDKSSKLEKVSEALHENIVDNKIDHLTCEMVNEFIERIVIYEEDQMEIVWKFTDFIQDALPMQHKSAVYCRVCNNENDALQEQEKQLIQFAVAHGNNDVKVYSECCSGLTKNRIEMARLLNDIKNGDVNLIYMRDMSRISRRYPDAQKIYGEIKKYGAKIVFSEE